MKRYRFLSNTYLDFTRNLFKFESLHPQLLQQEREQLKGELSFKYGQFDIDNKIARYLEFDPPNMCIITEYLDLLHTVGDAYIFGSYYPALTGACSLGERVFNILILKLRRYHKSHHLYKKIYSKESFQDWEKAITVLKEWNIIDAGLETDYRKLADLRNQSIHFRNVDIQTSSLTALRTVMAITDKLFGMKAYYLFWCPGEIYVKKSKETEPFVKEFILPNCVPVGYKHTVVEVEGVWKYQDYDDYEDKQITDDEYKRLRTEWGNRKAEDV